LRGPDLGRCISTQVPVEWG